MKGTEASHQAIKANALQKGGLFRKVLHDEGVVVVVGRARGGSNSSSYKGVAACVSMVVDSTPGREHACTPVMVVVVGLRENGW